MKKAGGCTSIILKCVNQSQGRKSTLSTSAVNYPNTKNAMPLLRVSRPRKTTLQNHKHIDRYYMNGWESWCCCITYDSPDSAGLTCTSADMSHRYAHFQTTAIHILSSLILCSERIWGQHITNIANLVLILRAGEKKPHQRVFIALLQESSINLLIPYFWPESKKENPDAASLNLKQTFRVLKIKQEG